jgi:hypothetical protein
MQLKSPMAAKLATHIFEVGTKNLFDFSNNKAGSNF